MFLSWKSLCPVSANQWGKTTVGFGLPTKTFQRCIRNCICNCSLQSLSHYFNLLITYEFPVFTTFALLVLPVTLPSQLIAPVKRKLDTALLMLPPSFPLAGMHPPAPQDTPAESVLSNTRWFGSCISVLSPLICEMGELLEGSYLYIPLLPRAIQISVTCAIIYGSSQSWTCVTARGDLP